MTTVDNAPAVHVDETKSNTMLYVVLAVVAAVAFLFFAALMTDARVGDGSADQQPTYVTGDTQNLPPVTSGYGTTH